MGGDSGTWGLGMREEEAVSHPPLQWRVSAKSHRTEPQGLARVAHQPHPLLHLPRAHSPPQPSSQGGAASLPVLEALAWSRQPSPHCPSLRPLDTRPWPPGRPSTLQACRPLALPLSQHCGFLPSAGWFRAWVSPEDPVPARLPRPGQAWPAPGCTPPSSPCPRGAPAALQDRPLSPSFPPLAHLPPSHSSLSGACSSS